MSAASIPQRLHMKESFSLDGLWISAVAYILAYMLAIYLTRYGQYGKWSKLTYLFIGLLGLLLGFCIDYFVPNDYSLGHIVGLAVVVYAGYNIFDQIFHKYF